MSEPIEKWNTKSGTSVWFEYMPYPAISQGRCPHGIYGYSVDGNGDKADQIAYITWNEGTIDFVNIWDYPNNWRRQGIATRLYELASERNGAPLKHSDDLNEDAKAWISSL